MDEHGDSVMADLEDGTSQGIAVQGGADRQNLCKTLMRARSGGSELHAEMATS